MTRFLAAVVLTLWVANHISMKQKAYAVVGRLAVIHAFALGALISFTLL